jgi:hypothetical protein
MLDSQEDYDLGVEMANYLKEKFGLREEDLLKGAYMDMLLDVKESDSDANR